MQVCGKNLQSVDIDSVKRIAESIVENQPQRAMIAASLRTSFNFGSRSKTKYLEKSISKLVTCVKDACRATPDLVKVLATTAYSRETLQKLMTVVDLGFRLDGEDELSVINIVFNMAMFGVSLKSDWQFYLLKTPVGLSMMWDLSNRPENSSAFYDMLVNASVMGVTATDILVALPTMGFDICDNDGYMAMAANFGARRIVYEALTRGPRAVSRRF
jgi:hypothetical protein